MYVHFSLSTKWTWIQGSCRMLIKSPLKREKCISITSLISNYHPNNVLYFRCTIKERPFIDQSFFFFIRCVLGLLLLANSTEPRQKWTAHFCQIDIANLLGVSSVFYSHRHLGQIIIFFSILSRPGWCG